MAKATQQQALRTLRKTAEQMSQQRKQQAMTSQAFKNAYRKYASKIRELGGVVATPQQFYTSGAFRHYTAKPAVGTQKKKQRGRPTGEYTARGAKALRSYGKRTARAASMTTRDVENR